MHRLPWKPADILLLKGGQLGILFVEISLRIGQLLLQKVGRAFGRLLARIQIRARQRAK